jgi:hypothetical protein
MLKCTTFHLLLLPFLEEVTPEEDTLEEVVAAEAVAVEEVAVEVLEDRDQLLVGGQHHFRLQMK